MKILSLFDGISALQVALNNCGIKDYQYFASEIDKYAISVTQKNFPKTVQLGDVKNLKFIFCEEYGDKYINSYAREYDYDFDRLIKERVVLGNINEYFGDTDLLCGGSPCQDLSIAKKDRKGLDGERSGLFYEYVRILNEVKPKFFILENVASMSKEAKQEITSHLYGIEPILLNSALVSAQQRKRLFWVGKLQEDGTYAKVEIPQPEDRGILLKDILESGLPYQDKAHSLTASYSGAVFWNSIVKKQKSMVAIPMPTVYIEDIQKKDNIHFYEKEELFHVYDGEFHLIKASKFPPKFEGIFFQVRKLTPNECARLQGFPDNYTNEISNTQAYKCYGNSFTVPIIEHILKYL